MAQCGALDDLFDWNLKKLTIISTFIDGYKTCAMTSYRFVLNILSTQESSEGQPAVTKTQKLQKERLVNADSPFFTQ